MVTRINEDGSGQAGPAPEAPDDFAGLEAQAGTLEAAAQPVDPDKPTPGQVAEEAAEMVEFASSLFLPLMPDRYAERYGPQERKRIGVTFAALCVARGWSMGDVIGRWGPELALAAAVLGPALPVVIADLKARRVVASGDAT